MFRCCMKGTAELPPKLHLRSVQNPLRPNLMTKPSLPKPTSLEREIHEADTNFEYCIEKGDLQRSLHWAKKLNHLQNLFAKSRNGEQHDAHAPQQHSQESQESPAGGWSQEDPCGRHEGPGVPRDSEAHIRRPEEVRPDEDQEGSHCQQEEACAR